MAFNTGLSGLRAAQVDLDVTGNNIANASTVGFKSSRAQFGDLYANGFLSSGSNPVGDGVTVQDIQQQFGQGNISFTDNGLDMAIDGDGFFVLSDGGETRYSRAGQFGIDKEGYVVNNQNMKVQGFQADEDGNISGVRGDLQIETDNLAPRRTTNLQTDLNLDSRESVLERQVKNFSLNLGEFDQDGSGSEVLTFAYADGSADQPVTISDTSSAKAIADALGLAPGVNASGTTSAEVDATATADSDGNPYSTSPLNTVISNGNLEFSINGQQLNVASVSNLQDLANVISNFGNNSISASVDGNNLSVRDSSGEPLDVQWGDTSTTNASEPTVGEVSVSTDRTVETVTSDEASSEFVSTFDTTDATRINAFNPIDQRTYNHATSTTVYDSLGNSHELTQFYVKEPSPGNGVGQSQWSIYMQIDGELVGGTDQAPYTATFNESGELDSITDQDGDVSANGEIIITDWTPKDPSGDPNGADGPPSDPDSVVSPIPEPATSSALVVDLGDATQYGSAFGVNDQQQNGYTTGRLSGLDVSDEGVIFARYTNGQSNELGQVALATFSNTDGLSPVGDTAWVETFESGQPVVGKPNTGTLGAIASSSVEESNVDLSEELVNLIIAQRNYQANAKTIETSDAVTQTIINLR
ncbi:flagellar hook protein FlgE [Marinobacter nauticus]